MRSDDRAVGRLAYTHLRECRLRALACCTGDAPLARDRRLGFTDDDAGDGLPVHTLAASGPDGDLDAWRAHAATTILALPGPLGVFCQNDSCARAVAIAIPQRIAMIGVDDEPAICDLICRR